jgi:hypothetical protein
MTGLQTRGNHVSGLKQPRSPVAGGVGDVDVDMVVAVRGQKLGLFPGKPTPGPYVR